MLWIFIFLLQAYHILAPSPGNYYNRYQSRYPRKYPQYSQYSGYRKYGSKPVKAKAVTVYPRCKTDPTYLDIVVLDESGKPASRTKLWYVSTLGMSETWTANNGVAKVKVTGCEVGIIAWIEGKQSEYRKVNLDDCKDNYHKVVIQLDQACNFFINFEGDDSITMYSVGQKSDQIDYVIHTGSASTSGSFVGGVDASPVCVSVKSDDELYMVIRTQSSDFPNVLYLESVKEGGNALASVPLPISYLSPDIDYCFFMILNIWPIDDSDLVDGPLATITDFELLPSHGDDITTDYSFTVGVAHCEMEKSKAYLIVVQLDTTGINNKGNAFLTDTKGNVRLVEFPKGDPYDGQYWAIGCMRECLHDFRETNELLYYDQLPAQDEIEEYCGYETY